MSVQGLDNTKVKGKSASGKWRDCTVVKHRCGNASAPLEKLSILLHFDGFDVKFDEWIDMAKEADRVKEVGGEALMDVLTAQAEEAAAAVAVAAKVAAAKAKAAAAKAKAAEAAAAGAAAEAKKKMESRANKTPKHAPAPSNLKPDPKQLQQMIAADQARLASATAARVDQACKYTPLRTAMPPTVASGGAVTFDLGTKASPAKRLVRQQTGLHVTPSPPLRNELIASEHSQQPCRCPLELTAVVASVSSGAAASSRHRSGIGGCRIGRRAFGYALVYSQPDAHRCNGR